MLTESGIWIDELHIPYEEIEEFRTIYIPVVKEKLNGKTEIASSRTPLSVLELRLKKVKLREIELEDQSPIEVRDTLLHFVPESADTSTWPYVVRLAVCRPTRFKTLSMIKKILLHFLPVLVLMVLFSDALAADPDKLNVPFTENFDSIDDFKGMGDVAQGFVTQIYKLAGLIIVPLAVLLIII